MDNTITLDRDFVAGLIAIGAATARAVSFEPKLELVLEMFAPSDDEVDEMIETAIEDYGA